MKRTFPLVAENNKPINMVLKINGRKPSDNPYISVEREDFEVFVQDKDLERLAVNILKTIKSGRLK